MGNEVGKFAINKDTNISGTTIGSQIAAASGKGSVDGRGANNEGNIVGINSDNNYAKF